MKIEFSSMLSCNLPLYLNFHLQKILFHDVFPNISRSNVDFSKTIFALKPGAQAGCFEYNEPFKQIFFCKKEWS